MAKKKTAPQVIWMGGVVDQGTGVPLDSAHYTAPFTIGNTSETPLAWVQSGPLLVSKDTLCLNISWNTLNRLGFVSGRPVTIDGKPYLCRSIRTGGKDKGGELRWIFGDTVDEEEVWNWSRGYFWCWNDAGDRNKPSDEQPASGFVFMGIATWVNPERWAGIGFRPVLEPLPPALPQEALQVGQSVTAFGLGGTVRGRVVEISSYDLVLEPDDQNPAKYPWAVVQGGLLVVDKSAILHLQENTIKEENQ